MEISSLEIKQLLNPACENCGHPLNRSQTKWCSTECKNVFYNKTGNVYDKQKARGLNRKITLINAFGGGCSKCNYSKNLAALEFHHRNPQQKLFPLDARHISNRNFESLLKEAQKCELLCANCHAENHNPTLDREFLGSKW